MGRWSDAAREYQAIVPYENENPGLMRVIAHCLKKSSSYRGAAIIYRDLALKQPDRADDAKNLVFCLFKMGRKEQAAQLMEAAARHLPQGRRLPSLSRLDLRPPREDRESGRSLPSRHRYAAKSWQAHEGLSGLYAKQGLREMANRYKESAYKLKAGARRKKAVKKP